MKGNPKSQADDALDRTAFSVAQPGDASERRAYWHSRTPDERLRHVETLRRLNYGAEAIARLHRVPEIVQLSRD